MRSHAKAASAASIEGEKDSFSLGVLGLCALAAFFLIGMLGASIAQATNSFVSAGEITAGELASPARIAVDEASGDVLVIDTARNRVDVFDSSGPGAGLLTTFGESELSGPYGIAIDQSNGDVYVTDAGNELIRRYSTDGAPTPTYTLDAGYAGPAAGTGAGEVGSFSSAIAVDPTNGDLLVADRGNDRVSRFDSSGAFVASFDGSDSPDGAFTYL
ncbi:MAG TPA: NHL repeat-containing protein, partial [Solirubrobacterales bacterium]|nr:NHL repeat-containing protein [Solirubrobacterales bacterium]